MLPLLTGLILAFSSPSILQASVEVTSAAPAVHATTVATNVDGKCDEACQRMMNSQNQFITWFCIPVPNDGGDGVGCLASTTDCTITTSQTCNPQFPDGDDALEVAGLEVLIRSDDGRVLSEAALCATDRHLIGELPLEFAHSRQQSALVERLQDRITTAP